MNDAQTGAWTTDRIIAILRTLAEEEELPAHLLNGEISAKDTVDTLGVDSIGAVALIDRLESEIGVPLPDDFLDLEDDIAGIAARMNALS